MLRFGSFLLLVMLGVAFAPPAFADTVAEREAKRKAMIKSMDSTPGEIYFGIDHSTFANPYYKKEVNDVLRLHLSDRLSAGFDFGRMRDYYRQTSQYDPFADRVKERMYALSYVVAQNGKEENTQKALDEFSEIIKDHMANINVIALATSLAREDTRYGDYKFYQWISQGLMHTVLRAGDGSSFEEAFQVICTDEEDLILRHLKVIAVKSELIPYGTRYYNLHTVRDLSNGETREIFIDVTMPLAKAESIKNKEGKPLNIRR